MSYLSWTKWYKVTTWQMSYQYQSLCPLKFYYFRLRKSLLRQMWIMKGLCEKLKVFIATDLIENLHNWSSPNWFKRSPQTMSWQMENNYWSSRKYLKVNIRKWWYLHLLPWASLQHISISGLWYSELIFHLSLLYCMDRNCFRPRSDNLNIWL